MIPSKRTWPERFGPGHQPRLPYVTQRRAHSWTDAFSPCGLPRVINSSLVELHVSTLGRLHVTHAATCRIEAEQDRQQPDGRFDDRHWPREELRRFAFEAIV